MFNFRCLWFVVVTKESAYRINKYRIHTVNKSMFGQRYFEVE